MKVLFLCTAHNSLSQRLSLDLTADGHDVSVELALSDAAMIAGVELFDPDIVICPFLTTRVPTQIYNKVLTLIMHPGPPGDAGPSAIDWLLMGDDGTIDEAAEVLRALDSSNDVLPGRSHWGITVFAATEAFDAGPVWAFEQFPIDIDHPGLTKSSLYRGPITRAVVVAVRCALTRVHAAAGLRRLSIGKSITPYSPDLRPQPAFGSLSVTHNIPFQGGKTHDRPLLKAAHRDFDQNRHSARQVSRRIRCGDSQPGVLSKVFGQLLYIYGGTIEDNLPNRKPVTLLGSNTKVLGVRNEAVCIATRNGRGVWISHVRRPKGQDPALWPKVPATICLLELGILTPPQIRQLHWPSTCDYSPASWSTYQEIWVEFDIDADLNKSAYLYFDFYNGAMSTDQCQRLIQAMDYIISESTTASPVRAVTFMGGAYFSNGIALNVIEAAKDPANESWDNINRIDDVVYHILHKFPMHDILTIAAVRGNAAAGGVALAAACDVAIAGSEVVLNPAYRAIGLYGSEYHTLTYFGRCGKPKANKILRSMTPMNPLQAQRIGLIDYVFPGSGPELEDYIRTHVSMLLQPGCLKRGLWKVRLDMSSSTLGRIRTTELSEMSKDFWSVRAVRYHGRRFDFVRKVKPESTPLRFAKHRRQADKTLFDLEETDDFDDMEYFRKSAEEQLLSKLREQMRDEMGTTERINSGVSLRNGTPVMSPYKSPLRSSPHTPGGDMLFPCYYSPVKVENSPPETPLETPFSARMAENQSFFASFGEAMSR